MGKLIRDKIPDIIRENGEEPVVRTLVGEELGKALLDKLIEEATELCMALDEGGEEALFEERADVEEVLWAIDRHFGLSEVVVEEVRMDKAEARGLFDEGFYLEEVKDE